jgi:hypothetical protein
MSVSYSLFVVSFALSLAALIKGRIKNIADMTSCFAKLEALHAVVCDQTAGDDPKNNECLGWSLDSRQLPSGCFFKLKRI